MKVLGGALGPRDRPWEWNVASWLLTGVALGMALVLQARLSVSLTSSVVHVPFLENGDNGGTCVKIFA